MNFFPRLFFFYRNIEIIEINKCTFEKVKVILNISVLLTEKRASLFVIQASRQLHFVVVDEEMYLYFCAFLPKVYFSK